MIKPRKCTPVSSLSSSADIAFLLLIFFLTTTIINDEKGLLLKLPPKIDSQPPVPIKDRNLYTIKVNAKGRLLVNGKLKKNMQGISLEIHRFVMNHGRLKEFSEKPSKAVVSIATSRNATYSSFIAVFNEVQKSYYQIYAKRVHLTTKQFRELDVNDPVQRELYQLGREGIPMNISISDPF